MFAGAYAGPVSVGKHGAPRVGGALAVAVLVGAAFLAASARADSATCIAAADRAQSALESKKLVEAGEAASVCAAKVCPDVVRSDCNRWLKQVRREVATAVFRVVDRNSVEVAGARIEAEGPWGRRQVVTGERVDLDPGSYKLTYDLGSVHGEKSVVLGIGEKNDGIVILAEPVVAPATKPGSSQGPATPWPWVAGGVAVVSLTTFGVLQLTSSSKFSELEETCGRKGTGAGCSDDAIGGVKTQVAISGVALGVGLVAGAAAVVSYLLEPKAAKAPPAARFVPQRGGGAVSFAF